MLKRKLRLFLWRWHRRIGLMAALFILLLSITGILLNHSHSFGLGKHYLAPSITQLFYGIQAPDITSFAFKGGWISHIEGGQLYYDAKEFSDCHGNLAGVLDYDLAWLVACKHELLLFTPDGELIERIGKRQGLPLPIDNIGFCGQKLCLQSEGIAYQLDIDQLIWPIESQVPADWSQPGRLPNNLRDTLVSHTIGSGMNWERFLLDLHSGRLWGDWGVYLMDAMAILFIMLGLSGVLIWFTKK